MIILLDSIGRQVCNIESLLESRVGYELNLGPLVVPFTSTYGERDGDIINTKIKNCKHLHALLYEWQDHALPGQKLSTSACFAFRWYCGNLTNECSFTYSSSSVKCPFCWNWMLGSFKLRKKKKCSLHLQKWMVAKAIFLFTMCYFSEFSKRRTWILRKNDP